jgi:hypothetical protein
MLEDSLSYERAAELHAHFSSLAETRKSRQRRYRIAITGVILVAVSGGLSAYFGTSSSDSRALRGSTQGSAFGLPRGPWKPPVAAFGDRNTRAVSLAQAKAQADFRVLAPSAGAVTSAVPDLTGEAPAAEPAATGTPADDAMRVVWLDHGAFTDGSKRDVVAFAYNHLEILEEQMDSSYDGPSNYRASVDQQADPNAQLETVQGTTAYVAPPNDDQGMAHPGYVMFMKGNVQIMVEGYYPAKDLLTIANSLS